MSRIPRDVSGAELIKSLRRAGYETVRQSGSHVRLTTTENGEHHITIPLHSPVSVGTLTEIVGDIARHHGLTRDEAIRLLFG